MKRVEIIVVGREILIGKTLERNSNWISKRILGLGGMVKRVVCVDDELEEISREIRTSISNGAILIITTGGLGPTFDDRTLEAVAMATERPLKLNDEAMRFVEERYRYFASKGMIDDSTMIPSRKKMAILPEGSRILPNSVGAAPGVFLSLEGFHIVSLPGVPSEMKAIFEEHLEKELGEILRGINWMERTIKTPIRDESILASIIDSVMKEVPGVYIKSRPSHFGKDVEIEILLSATGEEIDEIQKRLNKAEHALKERVSNHISS